MNKRIKGLLAVAAGMALVGAGAAAANAHDAQASLSCDDWSVSASNYPAGSYGTVIVDGVTDFDGTFDHGGQRSGVFTDDDVDTHRLQVSITSPDGWPEFVVDETVTGCAVVIPPTEEPEPTPVVVPQVQDYVGDCDAAFVLDNLGSTLPVVYTINGQRWLVEAGTAVHTDADSTRIAPIDGGYFITTDTGREWFFPAKECPEVTPEPTEPPVTTPPATQPPAVTPEPSEPVELIPPASGEVEQPTATPNVAPPVTFEAPVPTPNASTATLPVTGSDQTWVASGLLVGFVLLFVGIGFAAQAVRRKYPRDDDR